MGAQIAPPGGVESTYKLREAEGILDVYFYRKIGFRFARWFARLRMSPVSVTLIGGAFGVTAGHLYYYRDVRLNLTGICLHVLANALDNADGQLARLTGQVSRDGRIIDSVVDHLVWGSIYLHLTLRCLAAGASSAVWLLVVAAIVSHFLQGSAADYFRNGFLYFARGRSSSQLDSSANLRSDYGMLSWRAQPVRKFLSGLLLNFTRVQELLAPGLNRLRLPTDREFPDEIPEWLGRDYRDWAGPMFKWWGLLMTNARMIILFLALLAARPALFFWVQVTFFNILLIFLIADQNRLFRSLAKRVMAVGAPRAARETVSVSL
jgi:CDP-alcohol phosphatidyltransferase